MFHIILKIFSLFTQAVSLEIFDFISLGERFSYTMKKDFEMETTGIASTSPSKPAIQHKPHTSLLTFFQIIYYFTITDFATFIVPNSAFGIMAALATKSLVDGDLTASLSDVLSNLPQVLLYNWSNTLLFNMSNQRDSESIAEDRINKPWRPIASGKITGQQVQRLMLLAVPLSLALNYYLNVWNQGVWIHLITWLYNDLRGSEEIVIRDFLIAASYAAFNGGSLKIAAGCYPSHTSCDINGPGHMWTAIISAVIFTTMQVQDLKDRVGDRLRGRKTVVLFLGERVSRGSIAFFVIFWSVVCSHFWQPGPWKVAAPTLLSMVIAYQVTMGTHQERDWHSWYLWSMWLILLYCLPVLSGV